MALFQEQQRRSRFLSNLFRPIEGSTGGYTDTLAWDVERFTDKIAQTNDACTGSNLNTVDLFSTKELPLPWYAEKVSINVCDLVNRMAGQDPFSAANMSYAARFGRIAVKAQSQMTELIARAVELQAAQVLQTGQINGAGSQPYAIDFKPKASHFPTAGTAWSDSVNSTPLYDIENLADQISTDSRKEVTNAIFGKTALREFMNSDQVQSFADVRRMELIDIDPDLRGRGAKPYGTFVAGSYRINMWKYDAEYEPLAGGANVRYVDDDKVILLPDDPGLVVGSVVMPQVLGPDPRIPSSLITPPTVSENGWDLTPNVWTDDEGTTIFAGVRARVVMIPQGIDEFGTLTT
jgi:hypothetical protein